MVASVARHGYFVRMQPIEEVSKINNRRTSNYWIAQCEKTSVYRGTRGSRRSDYGPNESWKERFRSSKWLLASLVIFVLISSTNCEMKIQIVSIQYKRDSIITGPMVDGSQILRYYQYICAINLDYFWRHPLIPPPRGRHWWSPKLVLQPYVVETMDLFCPLCLLGQPRNYLFD